MFKILCKVENVSVLLPTKTRLIVELMGDTSIEKDVILQDVLYTSEFKYNLLSISVFLKDGRYSISFTNTDCIIHDKLLLKTIGKVDLFNGLYLFNT